MNTLPESFHKRWKGEQPLGRGFRKQVWRAFDVKVGEWVALKVVLSDDLTVAADELLAALRKLDHPNVVKIYDAGKEGSDLFIVEELLDHTLSELAPFRPLDDLLDVLVGIAEGLAYLHSSGFVHRDLKPDNCGIGHGVPKIFDFGTVSQAAGSSGPSQRWGSLGTRAPELVQPEATGSGTSPPFSMAQDVWAFGATAYFVAVGEFPFASVEDIARYSDASDIAWRGKKGDVDDARRRAQSIAATVFRRQSKTALLDAAKAKALNGLGAVLSKCMSLEPTARPKASELPALLRAVRGSVRTRGSYLRERAAFLQGQIEDEVRERRLSKGLRTQLLNAALEIAESLKEEDPAAAERLLEGLRDLKATLAPVA